MAVEIARLQLSSEIEFFLDGWEISLHLTIASASIRVRLLQSWGECRTSLAWLSACSLLKMPTWAGVHYKIHVLWAATILFTKAMISLVSLKLFPRIAWSADPEFVNSRMSQELFNWPAVAGIQTSFNGYKLARIVWENFSCRNTIGFMITIWVNEIDSSTAFIEIRVRESVRVSNYLSFGRI